MDTSRSQKKMGAFQNNPFRSRRTGRSCKGTINASPETIFPLLCSVREADWLPGSDHTLIYSESGYAEDGYIFQSEYFGFGLETWVRYEHKTNQSLAYVRCSEHLSIIFRINLNDMQNGSTDMEISLVFTSLTEQGNTIISHLPEKLPLDKIFKALNHYIASGRQLEA